MSVVKSLILGVALACPFVRVFGEIINVNESIMTNIETTLSLRINRISLDVY